jgi:ribosome biogenesis protein SLX9
MNDIQDALRAVEEDVSDADALSETASPQDDETPQVKRAKPKPGQIGEGKGIPLSKSQRKKALYALLLLNSDDKADFALG